MTLWDDDDPPTVPWPMVDITDPVVVAQLYGPDGNVLVEIMDRGWVPFGFQPPPSPEGG